MTTSVAMSTSMAEKSVVPCWRVSTLDLDAGRDEINAASLDHDAREPTRRGTGQRTAIERREGAFVAGTCQSQLLRPMHDGARQVRADLRERIEATRRVAHEYARNFGGGIAEQQ